MTPIMFSSRLSSRVPFWKRILLLVASCLLLVTWRYPLWKISLWAPQYPEGLSLSIWSSKITGDLTTINILNHYIGMRPIDPQGFAELRYFPICFLSLFVLGISAAVVGRKKWLYAFCSSLIVFALISLVDFWRWEYDFGHHLNEDAAIKMEDMTYQPPLIGTKEFLNMQAASWPDVAGYAFSVSVSLAVILILFSVLRGQKKV